jgi:hypothetical protein
VNKNRDEVEVFQFTIITEPEVNNCFTEYNFIGDYLEKIKFLRHLVDKRLRSPF